MAVVPRSVQIFSVEWVILRECMLPTLKINHHVPRDESLACKCARCSNFEDSECRHAMVL